MKNRFISFIFIFFSAAVLSLTSCEAFFTYNLFQGAADLSNISVDEAISSGDPAVMQKVYDKIVAEAAQSTGQEAADLYLQAADLALGISGLSDPSILLDASSLMSGSSSGVNDMFSIITDTGLNLDALQNVALMVSNANTASPGSVSPEMWLFSAAGNAAVVADAAANAGQTVSDYLGSDPMANTDVQDSVQALVYAIDILPTDAANQLLDDQTNLETNYGIVFP